MKIVALIIILVAVVIIIVYFAARTPIGHSGVTELQKDIKDLGHDAGQTLKTGVNNAVDATKDAVK